MDQLFDLIPDPIVHHIMSFLTIKHVTKSSILSKRFFFLWSSFPVIDFNESRFARTYQGMPNSLTDAFLDHIHHSILLRKMDTVLSEFRVKADLRSVLTDHRFDHAILFPLENRVKSMNLDLGFSRYYLPSGFVSKRINVLKLKGLSLDLCNLIQDCPSLRTVCLTSCCILRDVKFSSENLIKIELHSCTVKFIEIIAPNVHSFVFDSGKGNRQPCEIDILPCKNISYLSLHNVVNGIDRIEKHVESLGRLKTFILKGCQDLDRIRVWNDKLERLEIGNCPALAFIELITPSLKSFVYKGSNQNRNCIISFLVSKYISDLSIESSNFSDEWLEAQIAKLRWLESLRLKFCYSLKKTKVSHEKLKRVEFVHCPLLAYIELITPALESFVYKGVDHNQFCDINFESSKSIKDFSVKCGAFTDKWLENKIATFTSLESLCLKSCKFLKNIKIYHEKLQILKLNKCIRLVEVEIDTPKLVSFIYRGKMIEFGKIVTRSTCSATLSMKPWIAYNNQSFYRWRQMLSFFGHFKALKLICNSQKV